MMSAVLPPLSAGRGSLAFEGSAAHCNQAAALLWLKFPPLGTESKCIYLQGLENGKFGHSVDNAQRIEKYILTCKQIQ